MQNKGFVRVFAILLILVCLYYLSFSFVTRKYYKEATKYTNGSSSKESFYLDSLANKKVWFGAYTLKQCREMEVTVKDINVFIFKLKNTKLNKTVKTQKTAIFKKKKSSLNLGDVSASGKYS